MTEVVQSYAHGTSAVPLIGQTIGENLAATVARFPDHEALVVPFQDVRLTYAQLDAAVDDLALALLAAGIEKGDRVGIWSPNCAEWVLVQYATARVGAILVNLNPAYRTHEVAYALNQSGCRLLVAAQSFKVSDYVAMVTEVRPTVAALERVVFLGTSEWDELVASGATVDRAELEARSAELQFDDPINIQYTSGTTGFPKGATLSHHNILNNGYFVGEGCRYDERDRVCIPVPFYHCFGMVHGQPRLHQPRRHDGRAGARVRPGGHAADGAGRALHLALRRAHDVHRRAGPPGLPPLRPVQPADRDHGRLALPGRGHEAVRVGDAHGGGHDLLRHDRDLARVDADGSGRRRSTSGSAPWARCTPTSRSRSSIRTPGASCPAGRPASCARAATR